MLDRIYDLYNEMERKQVMLSFTGDLSAELITALLGLVERKLLGFEEDVRVRKRVFNVVMECLQNLYHHNGGERAAEGASGDPHGVVMIARVEDGYSVLTGNFMAGRDVDDLKAHLDHINSLPPQELRKAYQARLSDGRYTQQGGGGLGIMEIARKSGNKLEYGFVPCDRDNAFFSLNVNVTN
ncbi:MAG: SiaB family protein kinase [Flavobacteriales bacterium]|nr:SiaB family protein kinase [Flavobacteriales bacterium]